MNFIKEQHEAHSKEEISGIVYCHKKSDCTLVASQISRQTGIEAIPYHAGLGDKARKEAQNNWMNGTVKIAVATVAFGMGIDRACVRYVVHWNMSKTVEGFYQESGRAGRDGKPSLSLMYHDDEDVRKFAFLINKASRKSSGEKNDGHGADFKLEQLQCMNSLCVGDDNGTIMCRRKYLLKHFGEEIPPGFCNKTCDYCKDPKGCEKLIKDARCAATNYNSNSFTNTSIKTAGMRKKWDGKHKKAGALKGGFDYGDESESDSSGIDDNHSNAFTKKKGKMKEGIYEFSDTTETMLGEEEDVSEGPRNNFFSQLKKKKKPSTVKEKKPQAPPQKTMGFVAASEIPVTPPSPKVDHDSEVARLQAQLKLHQEKMAAKEAESAARKKKVKASSGGSGFAKANGRPLYGSTSNSRKTR